MSGNAWDADVARDDALFARLIETQFPALAPVSLTLFGEGWDNYAYRVNERWVFRFPRREESARTFAYETRWLPILAGDLPLPIPNVRWLGVAADGYPYDFAGYQLIVGRTCDTVTLSDTARGDLAVALGRFLGQLHGLPAAADAPPDEFERADLSKGLQRILERLERLEALGLVTGADSIRVLAHGLAQTARRDAALCWVHGDLYPRHIVVDAGHAAAGVIDWGDVHVGDPVIDLMIAWHLFDAPDRARFQDAYGTITESMWRCAQLRALSYGLTFLAYGHDIDDGAMLRMGRATMARVTGSVVGADA